MLTSITPLGERSRGRSWGVTTAWFVAGALVAGLLAGGAAGTLGSLLPDGRWRAGVLLAALIAAIAIDIPADRRPPSGRRQVNEDWLGRYRGWVYGAGFGAQLGVGVATIVTAAAIYVAVIGAVLTGSVVAGAVIGGAFGAVRGASLLPAAIARDPAGLRRLHRALITMERPGWYLLLAGELAGIALTVAALV